jgi:hypothetical protein
LPALCAIREQSKRGGAGQELFVGNFFCHGALALTVAQSDDCDEETAATKGHKRRWLQRRNLEGRAPDFGCATASHRLAFGSQPLGREHKRLETENYM